MILTLENNIRGGIYSIMGVKCTSSDEIKKKLYINATNLYGWAISQSLLYDEIKFDRCVELEDNLNTPDDPYIGYFREVYLSYPDNMMEKI